LLEIAGVRPRFPRFSLGFRSEIIGFHSEIIGFHSEITGVRSEIAGPKPNPKLEIRNPKEREKARKNKTPLAALGIRLSKSAKLEKRIEE